MQIAILKQQREVLRALLDDESAEQQLKCRVAATQNSPMHLAIEVH